MRFFLDNNLSPAFAKALHELCITDGKHVVAHLRDRFPSAAPDVEWIGALSQEGGWVVITQDRINKNDLEKAALRQAGFIIFCLHRTWAAHPFWSKAQNLVRWWPRIMAQAAGIQGGAAFRVPWIFSGNGKFEQIKV